MKLSVRPPIMKMKDRMLNQLKRKAIKISLKNPKKQSKKKVKKLS